LARAQTSVPHAAGGKALRPEKIKAPLPACRQGGAFTDLV